MEGRRISYVQTDFIKANARKIGILIEVLEDNDCPSEAWVLETKKVVRERAEAILKALEKL
jgi:hypothetical protein